MLLVARLYMWPIIIRFWYVKTMKSLSLSPLVIVINTTNLGARRKGMRVGTMTNNDRTYMGLKRSTRLPCGERGVTCCGLFEQRICSGWCGWGWWVVVGLLA